MPMRVQSSKPYILERVPDMYIYMVEHHIVCFSGLSSKYDLHLRMKCKMLPCVISYAFVYSTMFAIMLLGGFTLHMPQHDLSSYIKQ